MFLHMVKNLICQNQKKISLTLAIYLNFASFSEKLKTIQTFLLHQIDIYTAHLKNWK